MWARTASAENAVSPDESDIESEADDEPTAPRQRIGRKEQVTVPVDVRQMHAAARASIRVPDPDEPAPVRVAAAANALVKPADELTARVAVAGSAETVSLRIHNLTRSGISLEIPDDSQLLADAGTTVNVHIALGPELVNVLASIGHRRRGSGAQLGGVALRWDTSLPQTAADVERILAWTRART